ncbi:hypothetical protein D3C80_1349650 [compost metagenome]
MKQRIVDIAVQQHDRHSDVEVDGNVPECFLLHVGQQHPVHFPLLHDVGTWPLCVHTKDEQVVARQLAERFRSFGQHAVIQLLPDSVPFAAVE